MGNVLEIYELLILLLGCTELVLFFALCSFSLVSPFVEDCFNYAYDFYFRS